MAITLYLKPETLRALDLIKKIDSDFNKSDFFSAKILEFAGEQSSKNMNIDYLKERISQENQEIRELEQKRDYFQGLMLEAESKQRLESETEENKREFIEHKKKEKIKSFGATMLDLFEVDKKQAKELALEFEGVIDNFETMWEFMESKGIKQKSAEDEVEAIFNMKPVNEKKDDNENKNM